MKHLVGRILAPLALLAALPVFALPPDETADRNHFFPLVMDGDGFQTHFILTNVSGADNQCTLDLRGENLDATRFEAADGVTTDGARALINLTGAGAGTTLISTGEQSLAQGFATLECADLVVSRILLTSSDSGSLVAMTTLESAQVGTDLQIPVQSRLGSLDIYFSNNTGSNAICLPSRGQAFTALHAVALTGGETANSFQIIPLVADGDGFQSQLLVTNLSARRNQCTLELRGAGLDTGRFESIDEVRADGSRATLELEREGDYLSLLSLDDQSLAFGYATLDCNERVAARNILTASVSGELAGMAAISGSQLANGIQFPVVPLPGQFALVFSNDSDFNTSCTIGLNYAGGADSQQETVQVPSRSTAVRFLGDTFTIPDDFPGGRLRRYSLLVHHYRGPPDYNSGNLRNDT